VPDRAEIDRDGEEGQSSPAQCVTVSTGFVTLLLVKLRAVAYLRVSTVEQKSGYGLDVQEKAVRGHARDAGLRIVGVVRDEAISGSKGEDLRPGLAETLVRLENGDADVLLVPRLDRLARDVILQETILRRLIRTGKQVISVAEPDVDSLDGQRKLVRVILGAISEYEAWLIAARLRAAREMKKARGGYWAGRPPYGLRASNGALVKVPEEQAVIKRAKTLRKTGLSYRQIAARLDAEGHRPRSGRDWHPTMVARVVAPDRPRVPMRST
jgi:DNA invertase Pin-like site-specific DNA recombinase